jgi:hypothetical protein
LQTGTEADFQPCYELNGRTQIVFSYSADFLLVGQWLRGPRDTPKTLSPAPNPASLPPSPLCSPQLQDKISSASGSMVGNTVTAAGYCEGVVYIQAWDLSYAAGDSPDIARLYSCSGSYGGAITPAVPALCCDAPA